MADDLQGVDRSARGPSPPDGRYLVYSSLGPDLPPALTGIWVYDMTGQTPPAADLRPQGGTLLDQ